MKHLLTFLAGLAFASSIFLFFILPQVARDKFEFGYKNGVVHAQLDLALRIPAALGSDLHLADLPSPNRSNVFLEAKDATILVVERNGVKTLRDYDHTPSD